nr:MAG TPA_asm: hypothetical protein [Caudoviricetes sp.]
MVAAPISAGNSSGTINFSLLICLWMPELSPCQFR